MPGPAHPQSLAPPALRPLLLATVRPTGWLLERLRLQADGMAGHLDEFWPDIARSGWIGGDAEGWERGPYWLDGIAGIAYLLDDERLKAKVRRWVGYILDHQHPDGWFGPRSGDSTYADHDVWPRIIVLKALLQHFDATGDERVVPAALRFLRLLDVLLDEWPLEEWARSRWTDVVWVINQLHDLTGEDWLLPLAAKCREQGFDWFGYADDLPFRGKVPDAALQAAKAEHDGVWMNDVHLSSHGVNVAMGLKAMPVWSRHDSTDDQQARLLRLVAALDEHHGQASGLFSCDEHLAGRHPLTALSYAPCSFSYGDLSVDVATSYPFEDDITITVSGSGVVPLNLRIPAWATDATVDGKPVAAGTIHQVRRDWSGGPHVVQLHLPATVKTVSRTAGTLERGPLVFALPIPATRHRIGGDDPHATWEIHPAGPWNYAIDPATVQLDRRPLTEHPFVRSPIQLRVQGRQVPAWTLEHGAAAAPPPAPATTGDAQDLTLVPYGCTTLRVTELPLTS
ncbi:beta-L-arabinofuranosidase domain-containing protein [Kribbella sp. NPDC002412]